MTFSVLNVNVDGSSVDFSGLRKPAYWGIKEQHSRKSRWFTVVSQSFVKTVADHHGHAAYHKKH